MTKKILLFLSLIISIITLTTSYLGTSTFCGDSLDCMRFVADMLRSVFVFIPVFILSIILYKMRDGIYQSWFKFVRVWIPLTIFLTIISPSYGHGLLPIEKSSVSFFMSILFFLISLIIILTKSLSKKSSR